MPRVLGLLLASGALWAGPAFAQTPIDPMAPAQPAPVDPITGTPTGMGAAPTAPATTVATDTAPVKQKARGIAVALSLTGRSLILNPDANTAAISASIGGSLFAGYKLDRLVVGLAFDIGHVDSTTTYVSGSSTSTGSRGDTSFLLGPGVQFAILRSADLRIELVGAAQITFGRTFTSTSQNPVIPPSYSPDVNNSNFHLAYQIAPGLRYWAHPQFALTLTTGVTGDDFFYTQNQPSGLRGDAVNTVSLFGSLGALGVF
jgi:hypothetical protein